VEQDFVKSQFAHHSAELLGAAKAVKALPCYAMSSSFALEIC